MPTTRIPVTITLSEAALDALNVLTILDMRSKSQEIEYLILHTVDRRAAENQKVHAMLHTPEQSEMNSSNQ